MYKIFVSVLWLSVCAWGQPNQPGYGGTTPIHFVAADPTGACTGRYITNTISTGVISTCQGGTWAHAGGGVISITGTPNQITASASIGAITLSIPSSPAIPGSPTTTSQSQLDNSTKIATTAYTDLAVSNAKRTHNFGATFDGDGGPITTAQIEYFTIPYACAITGYDILAVGVTGTTTFKFARVAIGGSTLPTIGSNSISTNGVSISSGGITQSTTVSDFTSTAITAFDVLAVAPIVVAGTTHANITFRCN